MKAETAIQISKLPQITDPETFFSTAVRSLATIKLSDWTITFLALYLV